MAEDEEEFSVVMESDLIAGEVRMLVEAWCDRRCLISLRHVLKGYPVSDTLTDGWADLLDAL